MGMALKRELNETEWKKVRFGDIAREVKTVSRNPFDDGLEFYVGLEHLDPLSLRIRRRGVIAEDNPSFSKQFKAGQILFGKRRCYQKKAAIADFDGICSGDIIIIESKPDAIADKLLPYIIQSEKFFDWAEKTSSGSLSPRTKWKSLAEFELLIPPLARQQELLSIFNAFEACLVEGETCVSRVEQLKRVVVSKLYSKQYLQDKGAKKVCLSDVYEIASGQVDPKNEPFASLPHIAPDNISKGTGQLLEYKTAKEDRVTSGKYEFDENWFCTASPANGILGF